jgi:diguanylate cyclase (GGDEF)-like protein
VSRISALRGRLGAQFTGAVATILVALTLLVGVAVAFVTFDAQNDVTARRTRFYRVEMLVSSQRALTEVTTLRLALVEYGARPTPERAALVQLSHDVLVSRVDALERGSFRTLMETNEAARAGQAQAREALAASDAMMDRLSPDPATLERVDERVRAAAEGLERLAAESLLFSSQLGEEERHRVELRANVSMGALATALLAVVAWLTASLAQNGRLAEARAQAQANSEQLWVSAHFDALTNLPNRAHGYALGAELIARARGRRAQVCAMCLDVDRFKYINDTLGHGAGDDLLRHVGARLALLMGDRADVVASRVGGDEFWIACILSEGGDVEPWARSVLAALQAEHSLDGHQVAMGVSGGLAQADARLVDLPTLLAQADMALRAAKERGRGQIARYEGGLGATRQRRLAVEEALKHAVERDEFQLAYQPIVSSKGGVERVEALLRWTSPTLGPVSPGEFIPIAEDTGQIAAVGEWALRRACADVAPIPGLHVSVNLSAAQLLRLDLADQVREALQAARLEPSRLQLEITETALIRNESNAREFIDAMGELGVELALDDFGVGYSSLSYLRRFRVKGLKIDRSFVADLENVPEARALTRAMIDMARALSLEVTAEGVETHGQALTLAAEGCDFLQGYFFARPMPLAEFADWRAGFVPGLAKAS